MQSRRQVRSALVVLLVAALAAVMGPAGPGAAAPAGAVASDRGGTGRASVPVLSWRGCGGDFGPPAPPRFSYSCTYATVPLDYDRPQGPTIKVALKRLEAAKPGRKIGTLFVNPGGPGGSGVDIASFAWAIYPGRIRNRFDIVGFDPRGVARSQPLVCFESFQQIEETFAGAESFPVNRRQYRRLDAAYSGYTGLCRRNAGPIIDHMSTADVARDMDLLRRAVGDEGLTYTGYSYGSQLGSVYANLFPNKVRALVVDGVLDPIAWTTGRTPADGQRPMTSRLRSDVGTQATFDQFLSLCESAGPRRCSLAAQGDPARIWARTAAVVRRAPVRIDFGDGFIAEVDYQLLIDVVRGSMYDTFSWEFLAQDLSLIADAAGVAPLPQRVRSSARERASVFAAVPMPQTFEGFSGVACSDSVNPRGREAWWRVGRARDRVAGYFGSAWTWGSGECGSWPGRAADRYMGPFNSRTSAPVLVVGNTFDPATPYSGAKTVARQLPNSRLLTLDGWGHVSVGLSSCIDAFVARYLLSGQVPPAGTRCAADVQPFQSTEAARTSGGRREAAVRAAREVIAGSLPGVVAR